MSGAEGGMDPGAGQKNGHLGDGTFMLCSFLTRSVVFFH